MPFVYEGKEEIQKYMQNEVSMTVCIGRIANQGKVKNGCYLTTTTQNH